MGLWRWKKNQALLRTLPLLVLTLILMLGWESTRPVTYLGSTPQTKILQLHLAGTWKTNALWASTEHLSTSGAQRMLEADWKATSKVDPDGSIRVLKEVSLALHSRSRILPTDVESTLKPASDSTEITKADLVKNQSETESDGSQRLRSGLFSSIASDPSDITDVHSSRNISRLHNDSKEHVESEDHDPQVAVEANIPTVVTKEAVRSGNISSSNAQCDFTRGYWVKDEQRPFYSGNECKAFLTVSWACREMNRPDYEYEKLRWQPEGCDLPLFTGDGFLHRLRDKVVAFVGDSLGRQQFQSLICMITAGKDYLEVENVAQSWGKGVGWAYRFRKTNTTILFYWSSSLCDIEPGHPNEEEGYSAMHLDKPVAFLRDSLDLVDVVILNTGHHWNRGKLQSNKWHPYVNGMPVTDSKLSGMGAAMNFTVHKVVQWLDEQLALRSSSGKKQPAVFMRTLSPRHFKNGEWDSGGSCDNTRPQYGPKVVLPVYKGPLVDRVAENAVKGTRVHLFNITYLSNFREEGHISKYSKGKDSQHQDCLHWCLPGVPDVWNELLYGYLATDLSFQSSLLNDQSSPKIRSYGPHDLTEKPQLFV